MKIVYELGVKELREIMAKRRKLEPCEEKPRAKGYVYVCSIYLRKQGAVPLRVGAGR